MHHETILTQEKKLILKQSQFSKQIMLRFSCSSLPLVNVQDIIFSRCKMDTFNFQIPVARYRNKLDKIVSVVLDLASHHISEAKATKIFKTQ